MILTKHIVLRKGKKPTKIPLTQPLPSEVIAAKRYIEAQLSIIIEYYNSIILDKQYNEEKYSMSLSIEKVEGIYTYNFNEKMKTIMFVFIEPQTNNEILTEWLIE